MALITIVTGADKPTNITGGPHIVQQVGFQIMATFQENNLSSHGIFRPRWRFNPRLISPARGLGAGTNVAANATEKNHVVLLQVRT